MITKSTFMNNIIVANEKLIKNYFKRSWYSWSSQNQDWCAKRRND